MRPLAADLETRARLLRAFSPFNATPPNTFPKPEKMLLIRLLAIFLVLITNTWLLNPVRSDALDRYKLTMARRADRELSRLAGEPCTVSGAWRSQRQPRSISPSKHRPPAARPRTHTSRTELNAAKSAPAVCAGGCRFDTGVQRVAPVGHDKGKWGDTDDATVAGNGYVTLPRRLSEISSTTDGKDSAYVSSDATPQPEVFALKDAGQTVSPGHAQPPRDSSSTNNHSLDGAFSYEEEGNSSSDKVFPDSATDSRGLQVLYRLKQEDGDPQSSSGTLEGDAVDFSGEMEEVDPPASLPVGSPSLWGKPVPRVPPSWMTALYFSGRREKLKLKPAAGVELPRGKFSLELWVKPEGGQSNPAVIAGA